tara:strand:- start:136698 stop:137447 length:750 start_codon:yes stop_codon:yes gene_type:complete
VFRNIAVLAIILLIVSCGRDDNSSTIPQMTDPIDNSNIVKILFIGNSLTFFNDGIDSHVNGFYNNGDEVVPTVIDRAASPGFSLANHLNSAATQNAINSEDWDYVILQENGVVATTDPDEMIASLTAFKDILHTTRAEVFLFMTWAYEGEPQMTDQLYTIYSEASTITGYKIVPVGLGWRDFQQENNGINLLGPDGVHPSLEGTFFASAMFFKAISNQDINSNPYRTSLTPQKATYIKEFVTQSFLEYY